MYNATKDRRFLFSIIYIGSIHYFLRSWYRWTTSSPLPFSSSCCYWCHSFILSISGHHPWHRHKSHLVFIFFAKPIWSSPRDAHHDTHGWTNGVLSSSGLCLPHQTLSLVPSSGLGEYSAEHGRWMDPNTDTLSRLSSWLTRYINIYTHVFSHWTGLPINAVCRSMQTVVRGLIPIFFWRTSYGIIN